MNFQLFKLVLEKAEEPEIKLPTSSGSSKKLEWVAISLSGGYSWSKDRTPIAYTAQGFFTKWATRDIPLSAWETFQKVGIQWEFSSAVHLFGR